MLSKISAAIVGLTAAAVLSGCGYNMGQLDQKSLIADLSKDPASNCVVVSTPYGGIIMARSTPGVEVNVAGGTCNIKSSTK